MKAKNIFILFCCMFVFAGKAFADAAIPFTCYQTTNCGLTLLVSSGLGKNQIMKLKSAPKTPPLWFLELPIELPSPPPGKQFNTVKSLARFNGQVGATASIVYSVMEKHKLPVICTFEFKAVALGPKQYGLTGTNAFCSNNQFNAKVVPVGDQALRIVITP